MSRLIKFGFLLTALFLGAVVTVGAADDETYFDFLKATYNKHDKKLHGYLQSELKVFLGQYPESDFAPEASYLLARTYSDVNDDHESLAMLLKTMYLYPNSEIHTAAVAEAHRIIAANSAYKDRVAELNQIVDGNFEGGEAADRHYRYLSFLNRLDQKKLYDWMLEEYYDFTVHFKNDSRVEKIERWIAGVYAAKGDALAAVAGYQKYEKLFPVNKNLPYVIINRAEVLDSELREYALAKSLLTQVIDNYPKTEFSSSALYARAKIKTERFKDYSGAIADYRQLIADNPKDEKAVDALFQIADIDVRRLKAYRAAIDVYNEVVEAYPGNPRGVEALKESADLYGKLKDPYTSATQYARVAELYPDHPEAAQWLYYAGEVTMSRLKEYQQAKSYYEKVVAKYPGTEYAGKAQQRIIQINKKTGY
ncbi:MAG: tetratricopeptide repeat protein [Candidatus Zixiibacteriota bacterium]